MSSSKPACAMGSAAYPGHRLYPFSGPEADSLSRRSWVDEGECNVKGGKESDAGRGKKKANRRKVRLSARDYCTHSSLHGLKYIAEKGRHPAERLFWGLAFLGGLSLSGFFIGATWQRWDESPVLVSLDTLAAVLQEIPFPAVTLCNINKMKRSTVEKITGRSSGGLPQPTPILLASFMGLGNNVSEISGEYDDLPAGEIAGEDMKQFMTQVTPSCADILRHCRWAGSPIDCNEVFSEVITDDGLCCSFNSLPAHLLNRQRDAQLSEIKISSYNNSGYYNSSQRYRIEERESEELKKYWTPETGYPEDNTEEEKTDDTDRPIIPRRASTPGVSGGLTILLDAQLHEYLLPRCASVGFKVLVHSPSEVPSVRELGFGVVPGAETSVAVRPIVVRSTAGIRALPPHRRRCFLQTERRLAFFRLYSVSSCRAECLANATLRSCQCKEYFMPGMNTGQQNSSDKICSFYETVTCVKKIATRVLSGGREHEECNCQPACSDLSYELEVTSTRFPTPEDVHGPATLATLKVLAGQEDDVKFTKNNALLHIFFKDFKVMRYKRAIMYDALDFLSNIGGLLGLCLGFSFLSAVEIIYFATLRLGLLGKRSA